MMTSSQAAALARLRSLDREFREKGSARAKEPPVVP
jgi:hypothetical protein